VPDAVAECWAPFGVAPATGDTHQSALTLVDRYGFIRAGFTGVPDVGGNLPGSLERQLDAPGRALLAGHGDGWGAPQVVDSLRTLAAAGQTATGQQAPAFSLPSLAGERLSLEEYRGRPVVLNFWWSGCPPCRQEMPLLQRAAAGHADLALLLIDPVDGASAAHDFTAALHIHTPVLLDDGGRVAAGYGVAYYPTSVFVRTDGTVASRHLGAMSQDVLDSHLATLVGG
jgi:peroxiredoxin